MCKPLRSTWMLPLILCNQLAGTLYGMRAYKTHPIYLDLLNVRGEQ